MEGMAPRTAWLNAGHDGILNRSSLSMPEKDWQCFPLSTEDPRHRVGGVESRC